MPSLPPLRSPVLALVILLFLFATCPTQSAQSSFDRAEILLHNGKLSEAEAALAKIGADDPRYLDARMRLGTIFYSTGRAAEAEECFQDYLRIHETAEAYTLLAGAQFNQQRLDAAYASAKKALEFDSQYAKAYTAIGMIYTELKNWQDAGAAFRESLRLDGQDASTWFLYGRSLFLRNEFAKAKGAFETALKLNPHGVRTYENLGLTLDVLGDTAAAERVFTQGVQVNRSSTRPEARVHIAFGQFLFKLGRFPQSRRQLQEAVRVDAGNSEAHYELARTLSRLKQLKEAAL